MTDTAPTLDSAIIPTPFAVIPATAEGLTRALGLDALGLFIESVTYNPLHDVWLIGVCGRGLPKKLERDQTPIVRLAVDQPARTRLVP